MGSKRNPNPFPEREPALRVVTVAIVCRCGRDTLAGVGERIRCDCARWWIVDVEGRGGLKHLLLQDLGQEERS